MPINISIDLQIDDQEEQLRLGAVLVSLGAALQENPDARPVTTKTPDSNVVQLEQPKGRGRPRKAEQEPTNPVEVLRVAVENATAEEPAPALSAETAVDDGTEIVPVQPQELEIKEPTPTVQGEPPSDPAIQSQSAEEVALRDKLKATMRVALGKNLASDVQKILGDFGATTNKNVKAEDLAVVIQKIEEKIGEN
jgi:hypothetical protein